MSRAMRRLRTGYAALHTSDDAAKDKDAAAELGKEVDDVANAEKLDDLKAKKAAPPPAEGKL